MKERKRKREVGREGGWKEKKNRRLRSGEPAAASAPRAQPRKYVEFVKREDRKRERQAMYYVSVCVYIYMYLCMCICVCKRERRE